MYPYDEFGAVVCITLRDNVERRRRLSREFRDIGVDNIVEYRMVDRHAYGGRYGCFESHYRVLRDSLLRGLDNVLVFEDDVVATRGYDSKIMQEVVTFIKENKTWESIQLGYGPSPYIFTNLVWGSRESPNIARHLGCFTHAICLSRLGMEKIVSKAHEMLSLKNDIPHYDLWLSSGVLDGNNCFSVIPMQFDQEWCFETTNVSANKMETLLRKSACIGGRMQVFYIWSLVAYHRVIVLICLIILSSLYYLLNRGQGNAVRLDSPASHHGNLVALGRFGVYPNSSTSADSRNYIRRRS